MAGKDKTARCKKEAELLQKPLGQNASFLPPFTIDIGRQVSIGDNAFVNHSFTASAAGGISIGEGVLFFTRAKTVTTHWFDEQSAKKAVGTWEGSTEQ